MGEENTLEEKRRSSRRINITANQGKYFKINKTLYDVGLFLRNSC